MKDRTFFKRLVSVAFCGMCMASSMAQVTLNIDAGQRGASIGERHYGIFFEEINHAGDGGLYAELIHNRSFEDNASNPDKWWAVGNARMAVVTDGMLNEAQEHALELEFKGAGDGVRNEGFWGIHVVNGQTYKLSFWIKEVRLTRVSLQPSCRLKAVRVWVAASSRWMSVRSGRN